MIIKDRDSREKYILDIGEYAAHLFDEFVIEAKLKNPTKQAQFVIDMTDLNEELTQYIDFMIQIRKKIRGNKFQRILNTFKNV